MIAGLEDITAGEIAIDGRTVNELDPEDRDIAMVFQDYALYPHMTVFENMAFSLRYRGIDQAEIRAAVTEAARILEIEALLERMPRQLSGGQRQRVAMGRAIVREPKVFLFDEPLSNLDAKLRVQMRTEIKRLRERVGHDHDLRHPRPGRGDDARPTGSSILNDGQHRADRHARGGLRLGRPRPSSPASSARRR